MRDEKFEGGAGAAKVGVEFGGDCAMGGVDVRFEDAWYQGISGASSAIPGGGSSVGNQGYKNIPVLS